MGSTDYSEAQAANGVHAQENATNVSPIKVIIVGAGIAGLTAAVGLRQQGHHVHILEQSQLADEIGAAIHMSPNANGVLLKLGVDVSERGATRLLQVRESDIVKDRSEDGRKLLISSWLQAHRGHLHAQLKDKAISSQYEGPPAQLQISSRIVEVDAQNAKVTLENGDIVHGDVLIGADGVRSITRRAIAGVDYDSFPIGKSAFRFMVPREAILADPETSTLGKDLGSMDMYFTQEHRVIIYPCVNNTLLNIVCIHPSHQSNASTETYNTSVSKEKVIEIFQEFNPTLLKVFKKCDSDSLKVYPLFDALTMPTFIKDRLALIGDAAHAFTPFIGQGGATAIEDSVSLSVVLSREITAAEVPERLELYNKIRYERATRIQGYSRDSTGDGVKPGEEKEARMKGTKHHHDFNFLQAFALANLNTGRERAFYALSHNEYHNTTQALREYRWSKTKGAIWRQPTVFGPMPGILRLESVCTSQKAKTMTFSITFKTSGTLLRSLLPNKSYSFSTRDTVALASFKIQTRREVELFGNKPFERVLFEIHGLNYTKPDGTVLPVNFVPIVFENSADVITASREEFGLPSVFSDIMLEDGPNGSLSAILSWGGVQWAKFWVKDLVATPEKWQTSECLLVHRYLSKITDKPVRGESEIEEDILIVEQPTTASHLPNGDNTSNGEAKADMRVNFKESSQAGIEITPHNQQELPTLHHIVSRLAELPVFGIVSAKMWVEESSKTVSKAFKIS
ncbi:uncharacterized protein A1O9_02194 [Exophiala aquamarina CBS 119918]|uniref:FAD-binding domain-containing protein n=1 Tax=Exophiala aquamarina CBS 119918 TaxID=1182545 RepID=A0A072PMR0_9EURO|nr:uncharacterized protein A1O9_02194 [Exophiala aquamarina CBS 119918]KEF60633.1 hypothetical protein A1O9_02194 [Exophiala aquamarina CBS 119918]